MQIEYSHPSNNQYNQLSSSPINLYHEFKLLLDRAKTYDHLIFYNRRLVNIYMLAAYGFYKNISRDGYQQAKCATCGSCFFIDPIVDQETIQVKENFNQIISQHQEDCRYSIKQRGGNPLLRVNRLTILQFGIRLFRQILDQNIKNQQKIIQVYGDKLKLALAFDNQRQQSMLQSLAIKQSISKQVYIMSIFGWRVNKHFLMTCKYCGAQCQNQLSFDVNQTHRTYCVIYKQKYWEAILEKLTVEDLQSVTGEFEKTQGQVRARAMREQLTAMAEDTISFLKTFQFKIKSIKQNLLSLQQNKQGQMLDQDQRKNKLRQYLKRIQKEDQYQQKEQKNDSNKNPKRNVIRFSKMINFANQMSDYINAAVKKIKIQ